MKITIPKLRKSIRKLILEAWSSTSMPGWEQDLEDRAEMLGLERSDALLQGGFSTEDVNCPITEISFEEITTVVVASAVSNGWDLSRDASYYPT